MTTKAKTDNRMITLRIKHLPLIHRSSPHRLHATNPNVPDQGGVLIVRNDQGTLNRASTPNYCRSELPSFTSSGQEWAIWRSID